MPKVFENVRKYNSFHFYSLISNEFWIRYYPLKALKSSGDLRFCPTPGFLHLHICHLKCSIFITCTLFTSCSML